ncbi:50S ribosomal protein L23 [Candidatus Dojkabacteria bacterium]|nr:50S ribosomal protein L23 [Candidatus Dojkabacteria bacterium]
MKLSSVIIKPVVSEKSFNSADVGVYTFLVNKAANRKQVKDEIESKFKVTVLKVNILNKKGSKLFDWSKRTVRYRNDTKKAIVTLKSGDTIDIFK